MLIFIGFFCISIFDSCPSGPVWSGLILDKYTGIVMFVYIYVILRALRLACGFLRLPGTLFGLGGPGQVPFWSILFIGWLTS